MSLPVVISVDGVPRRYAWGSPTAIPHLLGTEVDGRPLAELWFGAHPDAPSPAPDHRLALDELITQDPVAMLGEATARRYDDRLPFLIKLLAAASPLSIQVHPDREQAATGFAAENEQGLARDAPGRRYRDANHKPELLCALTPFEALCGFRPVADTLRLLDALAVASLGELRTLLSGADGLRAGFAYLLAHEDPGALAATVADRARALEATGEWAGARRAVELAAAEFPTDIGVVLSLLLNCVRLEPGEAIFLGAGNVHAYLRGLGVEVMANSDNVLRCGLTPKHIDVAELMRVTDFTPLIEPRCPSVWHGATRSYRVPVPDFALTVAEADEQETSITVDGPALVLATSGAAVVHVDDEPEVTVHPGHAVFLRGGRDRAVTVRGPGQLFIATVGP